MATRKLFLLPGDGIGPEGHGRGGRAAHRSLVERRSWVPASRPRRGWSAAPPMMRMAPPSPEADMARALAARSRCCSAP